MLSSSVLSDSIAAAKHMPMMAAEVRKPRRRLGMVIWWSMLQVLTTPKR
jgi:hypothetical protein